MGGYFFALSSGLITLAACGAGSLAHAQFVAPANSLSFEDSGTLEGQQQDYLQVRDSKTELWYLRVTEDTKISVVGDAKVDCLRPGASVQFTAQIDKKGAIKKPIEEVEIFSGGGKATLGLFAPDDAADDAKPIRNAGAGSFRVRGKLAACKDGELVVALGGRKISGKLSDEVKVTFSSDDLGDAQPGDTVKIKAWYYDNTKPVPTANLPGKAVAEEIAITLDKPREPTGKKPRAVERPKASAKSVKAGR